MWPATSFSVAHGSIHKKFSNIIFLPTCTVDVSVEAYLKRLLQLTCVYFHWKVWLSGKCDLPKVAPKTNKLPTLVKEFEDNGKKCTAISYE